MSRIQPKRPAPGRSLVELFPKLAAQWNVEGNGVLTPKDVSGSANVKVWWRCPRAADHRW
jgi:hypothetical protein